MQKAAADNDTALIKAKYTIDKLKNQNLIVKNESGKLMELSLKSKLTTNIEKYGLRVRKMGDEETANCRNHSYQI